MKEGTAISTQREVIYRFYDELLNQRKTELLDELVAEDLVNHGAQTGPKGHAGVMAVDKFLRAGFPDLHFDIEDVIEEGDKAAIRWRMTGTHEGAFFGTEPTGNKVDVTANVIFRFQDNKVAEIWPVIDLRALFQQIGAN